MSRRCLSSFALLLLATLLAAHPHSFIDNRFDVSCDASGLQGLLVTWRFDEYFSESIIFDYDTDGDGAFEEAETKLVYDEAFINTANFNYFLDISIDGQSVTLETVEQFTPVIDGPVLIYTFYVPLPVRTDDGGHVVEAICYDPTYYINIDTDRQNGFSLTAPPELRVNASMQDRVIEFEQYGELPVHALIIDVGGR